jgi:hypothetical protein
MAFCGHHRVYQITKYFEECWLKKRIRITQSVPLATEPGIFLVILTPMKTLQIKFEQEYVCCVRNQEECVCGAPNYCETEQRSAS